jgi:uncharacterized phage protein gp47/JayE
MLWGIAYRRLSPEKQQLLRHVDNIAVLVLGISSKSCQRKTADNGFVGFTSTVTPGVISVETTISVSSFHNHIAQTAITQRSTSQ